MVGSAYVQKSPSAGQGHPGLTEVYARAMIRDRRDLRFVANVIGQHGGFVVEFRYDGKHSVLVSTRGKARVFPNLTKLAMLLRKIGLVRFKVNSSNYS